MAESVTQVCEVGRNKVHEGDLVNVVGVQFVVRFDNMNIKIKVMNVLFKFIHCFTI